MGDLRRAYDVAVKANQLIQPVDRALVAAGRKIADRIDAATDEGESQEVTKALYLTPHLVNILKEMQATPAARNVKPKEATSGDNGNPLGDLRAKQQKRARKSA